MLHLSVSASSGPAVRRSTQAHYVYVYTCGAAVCVYNPESAFLCPVWAHNSKEVPRPAMQARHGVPKWLTLPRAPAAAFSLLLLLLWSQRRVWFGHCKKRRQTFPVIMYLLQEVLTCMWTVAKERTFTHAKMAPGTLEKLPVPFLKCFRGPKVRKVKSTGNRVHWYGSVLCHVKVSKN